MGKNYKSMSYVKKRNKKTPITVASLVIVIVLTILGVDNRAYLFGEYGVFGSGVSYGNELEGYTFGGMDGLLGEIPTFADQPYVVINENVPFFTEEEKSTPEAFEFYSELDGLGRCNMAIANVGKELMPTSERENISEVRPTGWQSVQYDFIEGRSLYNRCHLLGFKLTGENANKKNLITGTRYMNATGMLPFEDEIFDYIIKTGNHVLYRVTPLFSGDELIARGVLMEAYSMEDKGEGVCFNVYVYNNQPGVEIDYMDGDNWLVDGLPAA